MVETLTLAIPPHHQPSVSGCRVPRKQQLDFQSADEVIREIERLRSGGYTKLKQWNLTQACEHLTKTMEGEMNGFTPPTTLVF
jgi:hypothetical protein